MKLVQVTVGKANPPDAIKNQRIATAEQQQRALTEQQKKLAEDQREQAELSRAKADNAYRNAMTLSAEQFLRLETIKCSATSVPRDIARSFSRMANLHPSSTRSADHRADSPVHLSSLLNRSSQNTCQVPSPL